MISSNAYLIEKKPTYSTLVDVKHEESSCTMLLGCLFWVKCVCVYVCARMHVGV